jgi:FkbM family methyltransferase
MLHKLRTLLDLLERVDIDASEKVRLISAYVLLSLLPKQPHTVSFLGYTIFCNARTNCIGIIREVFLLGDYAFRSTSEAPRIFDVGANIGLTTLFFKRYYPNAHITSFEAMPENFENLKKNIETNSLQNVTLVHGFLGSESGTREVFYNPKRPGGSTGFATVAEAKGADKFSKVSVPALRLSDHIDSPIDLLKMDVEGAEGEILNDLDTNKKLTFVREMVFEYHANPANVNNDLGSILNILENNNFSVVIYDNENGQYGKALKPSKSYHVMIRAYQKK